MAEAGRRACLGEAAPRAFARKWLVLASVLLGAAAATLAVLVPAAGLVLAAIILALGCALAIVWRPFWGLLAVVWLVPLHTLLLAALVSTGSVPAPVLQAFKYWKVGLAVFLLFVFCRFSRPRFRITWLDAAIGLFLLIELLYLFLPSQIPGWEVKLFALQTDSIFFLFYLLGRVYMYSYRQIKRIVASVLVLGWIASLFALLESVFFRQWLFRLGGYFAYLGKDASEALPNQFYTFIGGLPVLRPGSVYLNPIEFSFALLIPMGVTWGLALHNAYRPARRLWFGLLLMLAALLLALSRSAMLGLAAGLVSVVLIRPRMPRWLAITASLLLAGGLLLGAAIGLDQLLVDTVSVSEPSAQGHLARWQLSLDTIRQAPLGLGLGSTGPVARRFIGKEALMNESWYFQIATEMGIGTGLLFALIIALLIAQTIWIWKAMPDRFLAGTALGLAATSVALAVASLFLHTWLYDAVAFPFWLLAGLIVQLPERTRLHGWLPNRTDASGPLVVRTAP